MLDAQSLFSKGSVVVLISAVSIGAVTMGITVAREVDDDFNYSDQPQLPFVSKLELIKHIQFTTVSGPDSISMRAIGDGDSFDVTLQRPDSGCEVSGVLTRRDDTKGVAFVASSSDCGVDKGEEGSVYLKIKNMEPQWSELHYSLSDNFYVTYL